MYDFAEVLALHQQFNFFLLLTSNIAIKCLI